MTTVSAVILGVIQGLTEFIPVSSSGHLILAHDVFNIRGGDDLAVDAVLQLATILAVFVYFFSDIAHLVKTAGRFIMRKMVSTEDKRLLLAIIVGTIPAVIIGLLLEEKMETVFRNINLVGVMLIVGAGIMYAAEYVAKGRKDEKEISPKRGFLIGLFQCLALVPGISRSGATISGGLFSGLSREKATRFSFLLAFPIILGSGLKKLFDLYSSGGLETIGLPLGVGFVVSFVVGLLAIHFLITYLKKHDLKVFVWYRLILAAIIFIFLN